MDPLLSLRKKFPLLENTTYLNSNSLGAMPESVYDRLRAYADIWASQGVKAWGSEWWDLSLRVGNAIAPLIGAGENELSMHPNISTMQQIILSCFEDKKVRGKKDTIVSEELNFPSVIYVTREWSKSHDCRLTLVPSNDGISVDTERMLNAIDDRTFIVTISHVLFKSGFMHNIKAIIEKAHRVGAYVILDAYQSVGIVSIDVQALKVDFLVAGVLKWLCGGPGGCFLYVRPDLRDTLAPRFTGWLAHPRPFDFDPGEMEYRKDAYRFLNGTPSIPALYAAAEGPKIINDAGIELIRKKSVHQTSLIIERAAEHGFKIFTPLDPEQRGGTVTIDVTNGDEVSQELIARDIIIDYRKGAGIRIAPHFYNSDEEALHAVDQIKEILDTKAFTKHTGTHRRIT